MSKTMSTFKILIDGVSTPEYEVVDAQARADIEELKSSGIPGGGQRKLYYM